MSNHDKPTTHVAVVVAGDQLARPDAWLAALSAVSGVSVHVCDDLAGHVHEEGLDFVFLTGTGTGTGTGSAIADLAGVALQRRCHVAHDQIVAASEEVVRGLFAVAKAHNRLFGRLRPYARPAEHVVELLAGRELGEVRRAAVHVGTTDLRSDPVSLALEAVGSMLDLFGRPQPAWVDAHAEVDPDPTASRFAVNVCFDEQILVTATVSRNAGTPRTGLWQRVEFGSGAIATLDLPADADTAIKGKLFSDAGEETALSLTRSRTVAACYHEAARALVARVRRTGRIDNTAASAAAVAGLRVAQILREHRPDHDRTYLPI